MSDTLTTEPTELGTVITATAAAPVLDAPARRVYVRVRTSGADAAWSSMTGVIAYWHELTDPRYATATERATGTPDPEPEPLPAGLTISNDGEWLNWRGAAYRRAHPDAPETLEWGEYRDAPLGTIAGQRTRRPDGLWNVDDSYATPSDVMTATRTVRRWG